MRLGVKYFVRLGTRIYTCMYRLVKDLLYESFVLLCFIQNWQLHVYNYVKWTSEEVPPLCQT
jgi:hypothetical protein